MLVYPSGFGRPSGLASGRLVDMPALGPGVGGGGRASTFMRRYGPCCLVWQVNHAVQVQYNVN